MPSLLLISQLPEDVSFATAVAKTAGLELATAPDPKSGAKLIQEREFKTVMVDASTQAHYQQFEAAIQEAIGLFSDRLHPNSIHFISPETIDNTPYIVQGPIFGHLLMRKFDQPQESGEYYGRIMSATLKDRSFGLESFLRAGTKIQKVQLTSTDQKQSAVEAVRNYLVSAKFQARTATLIANAVDEILMNAMFDAPVDAMGKQTYASTPRSQVIKLEGKAAVEMQIGFDGTHVGITAIDRFGSLDKARLMSHVSKVYTEEEYKVKTSQAGAGLGLASVYRSGGSFFFASELREKTEVSVFFKRVDSFREFKDQFRFFSTQFYF